MEKKVTYTEVEADALLDQAKRLARESGRSVRVEAESLLSRNRKTRLGDHRDKARGVGELLAALAAEFDDLRAESGDDDGELAAIVAMLAASFEAFTSRPPDHPYSTTGAAEPERVRSFRSRSTPWTMTPDTGPARSPDRGADPHSQPWETYLTWNAPSRLSGFTFNWTVCPSTWS